MNLLFTGRGTSGSWQIRGVQLGNACGGVVKPKATPEDMQNADVVVAVKRLPPYLFEQIRQSGKPWVLDVVDMYPQPACTQWSRERAIAWIQAKIEQLSPTGVIWPNARMQRDCDTGIPSTVIYHHHRPDAQVNPIRETVKTVGYEGSPNYIKGWAGDLEKACKERGWEFVINPASLTDVDIVVAFRGAEHNGYAQKHWKSNVKLANCHGTGTPFVGPQESGYMETATGFEKWANCKRDLADAFDTLAPHAVREEISGHFIKSALPIDDSRDRMLEFLGAL